MNTQKELWVSSAYGAKTRKPIVELHHKDISVQMDPEKAREIALMLLECAEAAESDAFMFEFAESTIGSTENEAARLLIEFRKWREK